MKKTLELDARINTIFVYPPGTKVPIQDNAVACIAWDKVPSTDPSHSNTAPRPLIVVAPPSKHVGMSRFVSLFLLRGYYMFYYYSKTRLKRIIRRLRQQQKLGLCLILVAWTLDALFVL